MAHGEMDSLHKDETACIPNSNSNSKTFIASYTYNAYRELACNKGNTAQTRQN